MKGAKAMEQQLDQLITMLEQTRGLYERMLTTVHEEMAAATASDFQKFSRASAEKENLVSQLKQLEQRRNRILRQVAESFGISLEQLNISALVARIDTPHRHQLSELASSLEALIARVRDANRECCMIIEHCLGLVKRSLGYFQHWMQLSAVYGQTGSICSDHRSGGRLVSDTV
jgi:flagellar biosynthesis/type III secretory pathway chaperone